MPRKPHPYKGIPRSEWPKAKAAAQAEQPTVVPVETIVTAPIHESVRIEMEYKSPDGEVEQQEDLPIAPPRNLFSGEMLQLQIYGKDGNDKDPIPGFRTRWFNDEHGSGVRIKMALSSGWLLVKSDEIALNEGLTPSNSDLGSHVRKIVGTVGNEPLYAYLMKKPEALAQLHDDQHEQATNVRIEEALRSGQISQNPVDAQGPARTVKIDIGSKLYR